MHLNPTGAVCLPALSTRIPGLRAAPIDGRRHDRDPRRTTCAPRQRGRVLPTAEVAIPGGSVSHRWHVRRSLTEPAQQTFAPPSGVTDGTHGYAPSRSGWPAAPTASGDRVVRITHSSRCTRPTKVRSQPAADGSSRTRAGDRHPCSSARFAVVWPSTTLVVASSHHQCVLTDPAPRTLYA